MPKSFSQINIEVEGRNSNPAKTSIAENDMTHFPLDRGLKVDKANSSQFSSRVNHSIVSNPYNNGLNDSRQNEVPVKTKRRRKHGLQCPLNFYAIFTWLVTLIEIVTI